MLSDYPETRAIITAMQSWLVTLSSKQSTPIPVPVNGGFQYAYKEENVEIVCIAKAVRIVSGMNAVMFLADAGFTVEAATLLRIISDCANEIIIIAKGIITGNVTKAHNKFIIDYFKPIPDSIGKYLKQEPEHYVGRNELYKTDKQFSDKIGIDSATIAYLKRYLDKVLDYYIHGGYQTAMELYNPATGSFNVSGVMSVKNRKIVMKAITGKLYTCIIAFEYMAKLNGFAELKKEINKTRHAYEKSGEYE